MNNIRKWSVLAVFIIILASCSFAEIQRDKLKISIYVNEDGSAHVIEKNSYLITGNYSIEMYENHLKTFSGNKNDISFWFSVIGEDAPVYHIDAGKGIKNKIILPTETYQKRPYYKPPTARAEIRLDYDVLSTEIENNTMQGVFTVARSKPRTYEYVLNKDAIRFKKNDYGDVFLPEGITIGFILPDNSLITDVNPLSAIEGRTLPIYDKKEIVWENEVVLPRFSLVFSTEQRLDQEIMEFFRELQKIIIETITGTHGWAAIIIVSVLVISYIAMQKIKAEGE